MPPGRRLSGYVLGYCPGGYWFGYWFGGYCPGGYCPVGYWLGGYCPVGYWPPEGYCAKARTAHNSIAPAATTTGRKGRRILKNASWKHSIRIWSRQHPNLPAARLVTP